MVNIIPTALKNLGSQMMLLHLKIKKTQFQRISDKDSTVATMNDYCDDLDED